MKAYVMMIACVAICLGCKSQGNGSKGKSGNASTREMTVGPFKSIDASLPADIEFVQDDKYEVSVVCNKPVADDVKVWVDNGTLKLSYLDSRNERHNKLDIDIRISAPELKKLSCSRAVDFKSRKLVQDADLEVSLVGASEIDIDNAKCRNIVFVSSGASNVEGNYFASGNISMDVSGASDIDGNYDASGNITMNVSGASDIDGHYSAKGKFSLSASGASDVDCDALASTKASVDVSGASDAKVALEAPEANVVASGTSSLEANVKCDKLVANSSGRSTITAKGRANSIKQLCDDGSRIKMGELKTK